MFKVSIQEFTKFQKYLYMLVMKKKSLNLGRTFVFTTIKNMTKLMHRKQYGNRLNCTAFVSKHH